MSTDIFGCPTGERWLLAFNGWRSGVLLNFLQCTGQSAQHTVPTTEDYPVKKLTGECHGGETLF